MNDNEDPPVAHVQPAPPVVVHPVVRDGVTRPFRRVQVRGTHVGKAFNSTDLVSLMRCLEVDGSPFAPDLVEWRGDSPQVWQ